MTGAMTSLDQLEPHLWESANILRGPVDAADFKTYIFPLLIFKRISDVHDEEYQAALIESDGDEEYALFPQNYGFQDANLSIPLYVAPAVDTVQEAPGPYGTGTLADALSAWLESSQQVRQALDGLFETQAAKKKVRR